MWQHEEPTASKNLCWPPGVHSSDVVLKWDVPTCDSNSHQDNRPVLFCVSYVKKWASAPGRVHAVLLEIFGKKVLEGEHQWLKDTSIECYALTSSCWNLICPRQQPCIIRSASSNIESVQSRFSSFRGQARSEIAFYLLPPNQGASCCLESRQGSN